MPTISRTTQLQSVEHILGSGDGILDFAVEDRSESLTWHGTEDANWEIEDVDRIENAEEDRFIIYPEGEYFTCKIEANGEQHNPGPVRCWCED